MALYKTATKIRNVYKGTVDVNTVYLGTQQIWPIPFTGALTSFTAVGAYTYNIPDDCRIIDAVVCGGGGSGGGGGAYVFYSTNGLGGNAGAWATYRLVRGVDIPWSTTTITGTVGAGGPLYGAAGGGYTGSASTALATGWAGLSAAGGAGGGGAAGNNGQTRLNLTFDGRTYTGGAGGNFPGSAATGAGSQPGGGGAGGNGWNTGANPGAPGGAGAAYFYAY